MNKEQVLKEVAKVLGITLQQVRNMTILQTVETLVNTIKPLQEDSDKLARLKAYGVDNWSGYGDAMSDSEDIFEE